MSPNDVKELLDPIIAELELPLIAVDRGPQLVSEKSDGPTQSRIDEVVKRWMNGCSRSPLCLRWAVRY